MKQFPRILFVTRTDPEDNEFDVEYFANSDKDFVKDEEQDTEVAVYQLVKTGRVVKSAKILFE